MKKFLIIIIGLLPLFASAHRKSIYHKGWIDFNKNGVKDVFEDPTASVEDRVQDLLSQMTIEEKTCQMTTLYARMDLLYKIRQAAVI